MNRRLTDMRKGLVTLAERLKAIESQGRRVLPLTVRAVPAAEAGGEERVLEFIASTEEVASDGIVLQAGGWLLDRFLKAGAFLWAHNRWEDKPPIGVPLKAEVDDQAKVLRVWVRFAKAEDFPFADLVHRLYLDKVLRAVSVGFRILEMRDPIPSEKDRGAWGVSTKHELFELSAVPVPADSGALVQGIRGAIEAGHMTPADRAALDVFAAGSPLAASLASLREAFSLLEAAKPAATVQPAGEPPVRARGHEENCAALRDVAGQMRQCCDLIDALAADIEATEPEAAAEEKGTTADALRAAVESAVAPLVTRIGELEKQLAARGQAPAPVTVNVEQFRRALSGEAA